MILNFELLEYLSVLFFAATGTLVASRKEMDIGGYILLALIAGLGGGTLRDALLGHQPFWLYQPSYIVTAIGLAIAAFFGAQRITRRYIVLLWLDAAAIALYGALGTYSALIAEVPLLSSMLIGMLTALTGSILRDLISQSTPLILKHEIYTSAIIAGVIVSAAALIVQIPPFYAILIGALCSFILRAGALTKGWALFRHRPRSGRAY